MCPHDLLSVERVVPTLAATDKDDVLVALASRITSTHPAIDERDLVEALRARERQMTTALVNGVAIPHAKLPGIAGPVGALGRTAAGIECDAHDGAPTRLFFLLVGPVERPGDHLKALATVSRVLHEERCRTALLGAIDADAMLDVLRRHSERARSAA
ncbi:MAG TPA: PTS sugar transporter subunit IIA [Candidatus Binatia bacterium]|nr:PTS sugar transporter subunit IIA [Candidatus Binatia bacterium]